MSERRPNSIAQPGMTAWGRAAERELEAYGRQTALGSPVELADRVMAAIGAAPPSPRRPWTSLFSIPTLGRLRMAGTMLVLLLATTAGAALAFAGASALVGRDESAPTYQSPEDQPIVIADPTPAPTPTPTEDADTQTREPTKAAEPPKPLSPNDHDAVDARDPRVGDGVGTETEPTDDADEPDATDDREDDGHGTEEPDETEEPEDNGSSGSDEGGG
jgi:hypothetical protein